MYIGNNKPSNPIQYVQSSAEYPTKNSFTFMSTDISMCITLKHHNKVKTPGKLKCVVLLAAEFASKHYTQLLLLHSVCFRLNDIEVNARLIN